MKRFWYTAKVKAWNGIQWCFYGTSRPRIGDECPGISKPNRVVGYKRERIPYLVQIPYLLLLAFMLAGCDDKPTPPAISNVRRNEITERESLVTAFATADVVGIPADHPHEFLVRDTNGVIWYVNTQPDKEGRTRMFGWHAEFPKPEPPPVVYITNFVTLTNFTINLEDVVK